jgi:hypothetical protein
MAVSFDATSISAANNTSSFTWSHTTGGGIVNGCLIVWLTAFDAINQNNISGVTHDGNAMTKIANSTDGSTSAWYLVAPATGAKTISVTKSGGTDHFRGMAQTFSGVLQSPTWVNNTNYKTITGASSTSTINTLTVAATSMMASCVFGLDSGNGSSTLTENYDGTRDQHDTSNRAAQSSVFACGHEAVSVSTSTWTTSLQSAPIILHDQIAIVLDQQIANPGVPDRYVRKLQAVQRAANW